MALAQPNLNQTKSPFSGLLSMFSTNGTTNNTAAPGTPASFGAKAPMIGPVMPAKPSIPVSQPKQTMLAPVPGTTTNPNSSSYLNPTKVSYAPPAPTLPATAPKTTQSGMTINPATGGVSQPSTSVQTPTVPQVSTASYSMGSPAAVPTPAAPTTPTAPTTPASTDMSTPEYAKAVEDYKKNLAPTAEEEQIAKDQANIETSLRTAYTNTEGQAIPLEFITGQKRRLQESATNLAQPLIAKAALLQARRTAALDASKFALEEEGKKVSAMREASKPVSVAAGSSLINPLTGKVIAVNPKETTADTNSDPNRMLTIDEAKSLGVNYGTTVGEAKALGKTPGATESGKDSTVAAMGIIDSLLADPNLAGISGVPSLGAFVPGTATQKTKNNYDQLKAMLSLENRTLLKGSGAISDFEAKALEKASSSLGRNLSDADFKTTLTDLKIDLTIGKMMKDGIPNDVIEQVVGKKIPFSSVGNTSVSIPKTSRLSYVNNNPGNLRFAGQEGATEGEGGFAKFSSPSAGVAALENQIKLDASRGHTLESFVYKYAPPSENDTTSYINQVAKMTGAKPDTPISSINLQKLVAAIAQKESGSKIA